MISITLLLLHIWLTPISIGVGVAVTLLANMRAAVALLRTGLARVQWRQVANGTLLAVPVAGVLAVAVANAAQRDTFQVREILEDPSAIHISPTGPGPEMTSCAVVICVYTEDRWSDILEAVASVRDQQPAAHDLIVVVDHNPDLQAKLDRTTARSAGRAQPSRTRPFRGQEHRSRTHHR